MVSLSEDFEPKNWNPLKYVSTTKTYGGKGYFETTDFNDFKN